MMSTGLAQLDAGKVTSVGVTRTSEHVDASVTRTSAVGALDREMAYTPPWPSLICRLLNDSTTTDVCASMMSIMASV